MNKIFKKLSLTATAFGFTAAFFASATAYSAQKRSALTSIMPLGSVLTALTQSTSVGSEAVISGDDSPHTYQVKPSTIKKIKAAHLLVLVAPQLETSLAKVVYTTRPESSRLVFMNEAAPVVLKLRQEHGHEEEGHDGHKEAGHDGHDKDDHAASFEELFERHEEDDAHLWLSIKNTKVFAVKLAEELARISPDEAAAFQKNLAALTVRLDQLSDEISQTLSSVKRAPYLLFHDNLQYFEHQFGLDSNGFLYDDPNASLSLARYERVQKQIRDGGIRCIYFEGQLDPKMAKRLQENFKLKLIEIDGLGKGLEPGPDLYFQVMRNIAKALNSCTA